MLSRRRFVSATVFAAAGAATPAVAGPASGQSTAPASSPRSQPHLLLTANALVVQKLNKIKAGQAADPHVSGELAASARFVFEAMKRSGLTLQVTKYIKSNGLPPYDPSLFESAYAVLQKSGLKLSQQEFMSTLANPAKDSTQGSEAATKMINKLGYHGFNVGIHDLLRRRAQDPKSAITAKPLSAALDRSSGASSIVPVVFANGGSAVHPSLVSASAAAADPDRLAGPILVGPVADPECSGGDGDSDAQPCPNPDGDAGDGDSTPGDGDAGGDSGEDGGDATSNPQGDGGPDPGQSGDPDTTESANGTIVYEGSISVAALSTCEALDSVLQYGVAMTAAGFAAWAHANPTQAAQFAEDLLLGNVGTLPAFLGGVGATIVFYKSFCGSQPA